MEAADNDDDSDAHSGSLRVSLVNGAIRLGWVYIQLQIAYFVIIDEQTVGW